MFANADGPLMPEEFEALRAIKQSPILQSKIPARVENKLRELGLIELTLSKLFKVTPDGEIRLWRGQ